MYSFEFVTPDLMTLYTSKHLGLLSSLAIDERLWNISTFESQNVGFNVCEIYVLKIMDNEKKYTKLCYLFSSAENRPQITRFDITFMSPKKDELRSRERHKVLSTTQNFWRPIKFVIASIDCTSGSCVTHSRFILLLFLTKLGGNSQNVLVKFVRFFVS